MNFSYSILKSYFFTSLIWCCEMKCANLFVYFLLSRVYLIALLLNALSSSSYVNKKWTYIDFVELLSSFVPFSVEVVESQWPCISAAHRSLPALVNCSCWLLRIFLFFFSCVLFSWMKLSLVSLKWVELTWRATHVVRNLLFLLHEDSRVRVCVI